MPRKTEPKLTAEQAAILNDLLDRPTRTAYVCDPESIALARSMEAMGLVTVTPDTSVPGINMMTVAAK